MGEPTLSTGNCSTPTVEMGTITRAWQGCLTITTVFVISYRDVSPLPKAATAPFKTGSRSLAMSESGPRSNWTFSSHDDGDRQAELRFVSYDYTNFHHKTASQTTTHMRGIGSTSFGDTHAWMRTCCHMRATTPSKHVRIKPGPSSSICMSKMIVSGGGGCERPDKYLRDHPSRFPGSKILAALSKQPK